MKLQVEVISEQIIEPSNPTPDHLRLYKLSFIDQLTVQIYAPALYFYPSTGDSNFAAVEFKNSLKNSLPDLLTLYPPLAGRSNYDSSLVDCNDAGVPFFESRVLDSKLSDVVENSSPDDLNQLFPFKLDQMTDVVMGVQVTEFECGGIALAVCISHKIADAMTIFSVNNNWAAIARGEKNIDGFRPHLKGAELIPTKTVSYDTTETIVRDRVGRRFVFDASKVDAIRAKYADEEEQSTEITEIKRTPSKVTALSAFIFSRFVAAVVNHDSDEDEDSTSRRQVDRQYIVNFTVNIRPKMDPPLPHDAFGNYYYNAMIFPSAETLNDDLCRGLVKQLRDEFGKINGESLKKILNEEDESLMDLVNDITSKFVKGELVSCAFSSLCRLPLYEADFGFGKPFWVTVPALWFKNLVALMNGRDGESIEAVVHLTEPDMAKLENDDEFLKYATITSHSSSSIDPLAKKV